MAKPDALFSSEQGDLIGSSVLRNADSSNLRLSLLEGNKDHLLNQARSDLATQELHVGSLNKWIGELQRQTEGQRFAFQDAQYRFVESRREQRRLQEELIVYEGKSSPKYSNPKYARNGRKLRELKNEVSVQKLRDNSAAHFTIAANARKDEFCE